MTSALLHIFLFSTWGLGLLTWATLLAIRIGEFGQSSDLVKLKLQRGRMKVADKIVSSLRQRALGSSIGGLGTGTALHSKLQELVRTANNNHPEVNEIDSTDLIIGVRFDGAEYPPGVDEDEDDDD